MIEEKGWDKGMFDALMVVANLLLIVVTLSELVWRGTGGLLGGR